MDFLTDAKLPDALHEEYGGISTSRWDSLSRDAGIVKGAEQWQRRLAAVRAASDGDGGARAGLGAAALSGRRSAWRGSSPSSTAGCRDRPARATWAAHLDYLQGLLARYVDGADEVVVALRGLERFTALEAEVDFEWFLDVVTRAIGTLRSEDVIDSRPGAFAARGVNIVAVNSLVGIEFARVWILGATERSFPPPVRQDPILLDDEREDDLAARAGAARAALGARQRGGADLRAGVRGGAGAAGRLLRAPRDRREPAAAAVGVLPRARLAARGRAGVGRRRAAARPRRCRADPGRRDRRADPPRARARPAAVSAAAASAVSEPERDRTYLQARVTRPLAVATFERAQPSFARALQAVERAVRRALLGLGRGARAGRAGGDRRADARRGAAVGDLAGGLCHLPAAVHARGDCCGSGRSRSPSGSCGSTRSAAAASSTGSSSASTTSGRARARRRSPRRPSSGCGRSPGRSATPPATAARPATRRCGRPTGSS